MKPAAADVNELEAWLENDEKAKADLFLSIDDAKLKQVKDCATANDIWTKLESIFESKGPARKASLWKRLINHKLQENGDVKQHVDDFLDIVGKLSELIKQDITINRKLTVPTKTSSLNVTNVEKLGIKSPCVQTRN